MDAKRESGRWHARARSSSIENQTLRDTVNASQIQLEICKAELKKTKEQLKCLIHLVKRAWVGDIEASVHVANIVGVAPPSLEIKGDKNELVAVPKSAVLNNWASLTIGLLNQIYLKEEEERKKRQLAYLQNREKYLDKQLGGFIQDPNLRQAQDVASTMSMQLLQSLKEGQDAERRSDMDLQRELKDQRDKINEKQKLFVSRSRIRDLNVIDSSHDKVHPIIDHDLKMEALEITPKLATVSKENDRSFKKEADSRKNTEKEENKTPQNENKQASSKRRPRPKTSHPAEQNEFKVHIAKKTQRSFSAKKRPMAKTSSTKMAEASRRKSLESSFRREEHKLDQIERELKKTTSELQKKLNINPKGYLNFQ